MSDLMRTVEERDEIPDLDVDDDVEAEEHGPKPIESRKGSKRRDGFSKDFEFSSAAANDIFYDPWTEVRKYLKQSKQELKKKLTIDEMIAKYRTEELKDGAVETPTSDVKVDAFREKQAKRPLSATKVDKEDEEERLGMTELDPNAFDQDVTFEMLNLSRPLLKACVEMKFVSPTLIQTACIPLALQGRDICGCAATGTGKTAAYMLPILERLLFKPYVTPVSRVLVLVPTRELGVQVFQVTNQLKQHAKTIEVGLAVGGLDVQIQESFLRRVPDIVIATPGRLIDHLLNTPSFSLDNIEVLVLDEADRMLDEYFASQIKEVIQQCSPTRQTILFSATMTDKVKDLAAVSLRNPVRLFVNSNRQVAANLQQQFVKIRPQQESKRVAILASLLEHYPDHVLVFVPTKKDVHRLHITMGLLGFKCGELHGNLSQVERLETLRKFKEDQFNVMLATDVMARGLDIRGIQTVINLTLPNSYEQYVHRVGRTARAGQRGLSISLVGERERPVLKDILKHAQEALLQRTIDAAVLAKYQKLLEKTVNHVEAILQEEEACKEMEKAEADLEKAKCEASREELSMTEKQLKRKKRKMNRGEVEGPSTKRRRDWFQTKGEMEAEKVALKEKGRKYVSKDASVKQKKGKRKQRKQSSVDEGDAQIQQKTAFQIRSAKRLRRGNRLRAVPEERSKRLQQKKPKFSGKNKGSFSREMGLVNTSIKGVKRLRYDANKKGKKKFKK